MPPDPEEPASSDADPNTLLDRVVAGDDAARTQFFRTYAPTVDRFVRFTFGFDYDDASDVVQETMITAFRIIARFDRRGPVQNWLLGIAAFKAKALRRSRGRVPTPWSTLARRGSDRPAGPELPPARAVEAALGDNAAVPGADEADDDIDKHLGAGPGHGRRPPRRPMRAAPRRTPRGGARSGRGSPLSRGRRRSSPGGLPTAAPYAQLAADLSELRGEPVAETAVRQRASRFARDFEQRFGQVLPRSRVRMPVGEDVPRRASHSRVSARAGTGE
jgi:DNA-directed RNA polymerase specialized sigma24 family protein